MPVFKRSKRKSHNINSGLLNNNSLIKNIDDSMKSLYSDTYFSGRDNLDSLEYVADKIENNVNAILKRNNNQDISNISRMYTRAMKKDLSNNSKIEKELNSEIESLFSDSSFTDAILSSYYTNKWISDYDKEIDIVLKLLPKLREAQNVVKDATLSADSMSKDFIYPKVPISDDTELKIVNDRISKMEDKYDLVNLIEDEYDCASNYGEGFIYRVPYKKALEKLINSNNDRKLSSNLSTIPMVENGIINESAIGGVSSELRNFKMSSKCSFNVEIDTSRVLMSSIQESTTAKKVVQHAPKSLMESFMSDIKDGDIIHEKTKLNKLLPDDLEIPDGLSTRSNIKSGSSANSSVDVRGCVIKSLDRKNLIRIYVDSICMGYYYLEFRDDRDNNLDYYMDSDRNLTYTKSISTLEKTVTDNLQDNKSDQLLRDIARKISEKIDAEFINANQDLTKEIYAILKYNDVFNSNTTVRVSFLPPEDVKWLRFNEDKKLHMGISDINDSLYPAKMLAMIYVTYFTGTVTRGQDKRVYYVKQTIETNIAQTLLNVINQIKKSNFNMRSIENLNNLLNITGKFNDYIIPVGPSGDAPIQFEIMPGQEFNINQELVDMLEEMSINPIAPLELIQARMSPEFATQYTSSSLKLLRKTYRRQARLEKFISSLYTDIYAMEYDEFLQIDCELPPPVFLSMVNTGQLLENVKAYVENIANLEYEGETSDTADQEKAIFIKKMTKSILASYMRPGEIDKHKASAKFEVSRSKKEES